MIDKQISIFYNTLQTKKYSVIKPPNNSNITLLNNNFFINSIFIDNKCYPVYYTTTESDNEHSFLDQIIGSISDKSGNETPIATLVVHNNLKFDNDLSNKNFEKLSLENLDEKRALSDKTIRQTDIGGERVFSLPSIEGEKSMFKVNHSAYKDENSDSLKLLEYDSTYNWERIIKDPRINTDATINMEHGDYLDMTNSETVISEEKEMSFVYNIDTENEELVTSFLGLTDNKLSTELYFKTDDISLKYEGKKLVLYFKNTLQAEFLTEGIIYKNFNIETNINILQFANSNGYITIKFAEVNSNQPNIGFELVDEDEEKNPLENPYIVVWIDEIREIEDTSNIEIKFFIDNIEYTCNYGDTFEDWINNNSETEGFEYVGAANRIVLGNTSLIDEGSNFILINNFIVPNYNYKLVD